MKNIKWRGLQRWRNIRAGLNEGDPRSEKNRGSGSPTTKDFRAAVFEERRKNEEIDNDLAEFDEF